MPELRVSFTWRLPQAMVEALHEFESQSGVRVHVDILDVMSFQRQLTSFAIFRSGPDLSEVGTTWLSSLMSMWALRDFAPWEVEALEREGAFFAPAWQAGVDRGTVRAIPWRTDTRLIFYRRDLLARAGIAEATAFATVHDMQRTLRRLAALPGIVPCAIPTNNHPMILHILTPFVWQAGGQFMDESGWRTAFSSPVALAGIRQYFQMFAPAIAHALYATSDEEASRSFVDGQAAVVITGHWLLDSLRREPENAPQVAANLGVALTPGVQFRGGMSLVIWEHSRHAQAALQLVRFLTSRDFQSTDLRRAGHLPARQQALGSPPFTDDPHYRLVGQSLQAGRNLRALHMWSLVEERLSAAIAGLWQEVLLDPAVDHTDLIDTRLTELAARLDSTLHG